MLTRQFSSKLSNNSIGTMSPRYQELPCTSTEHRSRVRPSWSSGSEKGKPDPLLLGIWRYTVETVHLSLQQKQIGGFESKSPVATIIAVKGSRIRSTVYHPQLIRNIHTERFRGVMMAPSLYLGTTRQRSTLSEKLSASGWLGMCGFAQQLLEDSSSAIPSFVRVDAQSVMMPRVEAPALIHIRLLCANCLSRITCNFTHASTSSCLAHMQQCLGC